MKRLVSKATACIAAPLIALAMVFALAGCSINIAAHGEVTGIIGAMPDEVQAIKDAMADTKVTTVSGMDFTEGTIDGKRVVVVQSGMGKVNAGICAQTLINDFGATRVINTGVAGSLTDELSINDFVISTEAVQHDYDVSPIGFERGEIPYSGLVAFPADEDLRAEALEAVKASAPDSKVLEGRVCSGDQFIDTEEEVEEITSNFGGLCAEMEGGAIAQVCFLNDTPYVIVRAISDDSDDISYEEFQDEAARECSEAVLTMVRNLD